MTALTLPFAVAFALVHLFASRLRFLNVVPRSRWLSFAGGASVAYVFVHLLPELSAEQETLAEAAGSALGFIEHHVYLVSLTGLAVFYGLERFVKSARFREEEKGAEAAEGHVFWLHMASFAIYNALIGYLLLHREQPGLISLLFYGIAMGFHFLTNDYGLRQDHKAAYDRTGRWILAAAILAGWLAGLLIEVHEAALAVLFAFLAGGVVLNVLKEELPEERQSRFWPFAAGAAGYAGLLLVT